MLSAVTVSLLAEPFAIPYVFSTGEVISSSRMNTNFEQVGQRINSIETQVDALTAGGSSLWVSDGPDYYYNGGNVGIGTDAPGSLLHLHANGSDAGLTVNSANVGYAPYLALGYAGEYGVRLWRDTSNDALKIDAGGATRVTVDADGRVGIGTTSPAQPLHVNGIVRATRFEDTNTAYYVDPASSSNLNAANFAGQTTIGGSTIILNPGANNSYFNGFCVGIGTGAVGLDAKFQVGWQGDGTGGLANGWATFSDERYKEDLVPVDHALDRVDAITGYYFRWIDSDSDRQVGVVAQEVEAVLPEAVATGADGSKSVDYGKITALLVEAVKELSAENARLNERLDALEAEAGAR